MNQGLKTNWDDLKKDLTWDNIKVVISALTPMFIGAWLYIQWINLLTPIMNNYTANIHTVVTPEQAIISLCLVMGLVFPLWPLLMWSSSLGLWVGKITKFFKDNKTRRLVWDDKEYSVRDMPQEDRQKIEYILSKYKSKLQLKKERLANQSWLRRNFS